MKFKGFDDFSERLNQLAKNAQELEGNHDIPLNDLLNDSFLQSHTQFSNLSKMFEESPFRVESPDDFYAIPDAQLDQFIRNNSKFSSWEEMLQTASEEWAIKQLGF